MSKLSEAIRHDSRKTYTENGMTAYNSTGNALLDLFACAGSMRNAKSIRLTSMLDEAYKENPLLATKFLFYLRDIRGNRVGKGERKSFQILLHHLALRHPEAIRPNIPYIGLVYGRFDDLFLLIDTPCETDMWTYIKEQLTQDMTNMRWNKIHPNKPAKPVSLLAKWLKTIHSSNPTTKALARKTMKEIGITSEHVYRKCIRELREYSLVVETQMSKNNWDQIDFERVPAIAMNRYRNAFEQHDVEKENQIGNFTAYKKAVANGEAKIHTDTLFPYEIVGPYLDNLEAIKWSPYRKNCQVIDIDDELLELQWKNLPDYINKDVNSLVICDTSGSMFQEVAGISNLPIKVATSLAIYFAERNQGPLHNLYMEFSSDSRFVQLKGDTLADKIRYIVDDCPWGMTTNLQKAFLHLLQMAKEEHFSQTDMPTSIIVISDMQIDKCTSSHWDFYSHVRDLYKEAGYDIPQIVFWNVKAAKPTMLVDDRNRDGVQLISGLNAKTFAELMDNIGLSAEELMMNCLNNSRYDIITIDTAA